MKVSVCSERPILLACGLENFEYQVDTYVGCEHYCYYCYVLPQAETDWSKNILIYPDIVDQLSKELEKIPPQTIYLGYHTDPYQPCEAEYRQTRQVLELLLEKGFSASILTKSDLVVRDIDILKQMGGAAVSVSVTFNDNQTRSLFERKTIDTEKRIEALKKIHNAGIKTGALLCPIIPYITDVTQLINMLAPYVETIWIYGLSFQNSSDQNWLNMQSILQREFPGLVEKIEQAVVNKDHQYWGELRTNLEMLKKTRNLGLSIHI